MQLIYAAVDSAVWPRICQISVLDIQVAVECGSDEHV